MPLYEGQGLRINGEDNLRFKESSMHEVAIGQRFVKVDAPRIVWVVQDFVFDLHGIEHVRLIQESDRTTVKTVSVDALLNDTLFRPLST